MSIVVKIGFVFYKQSETQRRHKFTRFIRHIFGELYKWIVSIQNRLMSLDCCIFFFLFPTFENAQKLDLPSKFIAHPMITFGHCSQKCLFEAMISMIEERHLVQFNCIEALCSHSKVWYFPYGDGCRMHLLDIYLNDIRLSHRCFFLFSFSKISI